MPRAERTVAPVVLARWEKQVEAVQTGHLRPTDWALGSYTLTPGPVVGLSPPLTQAARVFLICQKGAGSHTEMKIAVMCLGKEN